MAMEGEDDRIGKPCRDQPVLSVGDITFCM